jgi:hypothetical protein
MANAKLDVIRPTQNANKLCTGRRSPTRIAAIPIRCGSVAVISAKKRTVPHMTRDVTGSE